MKGYIVDAIEVRGVQRTQTVRVQVLNYEVNGPNEGNKE